MAFDAAEKKDLIAFRTKKVRSAATKQSESISLHKGSESQNRVQSHPKELSEN